MKTSKQQISGGNQYPKVSSFLVRPEKIHQLRSLSSFSSLIARGSGSASCDGATHVDQYVVLMERINRFLEFDSSNGLLHAEAGISIEEILEFLTPKGWFLPVLPTNQKATLGGCVATDTSGSIQKGSFSDHVHSLEIMLADGSIKRCNRHKEPEFFWATVGGMGLTGIILEVTIQLIPVETAYLTGKWQQAQDFDQAIRLLQGTIPTDNYAHAWIDCSSRSKRGRGLVVHAHHATLQDLPTSIKTPLKVDSKREFPLSLPFSSHLISPKVMQTFSSLYYTMQGRRKKQFLIDYHNFFFPTAFLPLVNRWFCSQPFIPYQFIIPDQVAAKAIQQIISTLSESKFACSWGLLQKCEKENESFLSFAQKGYSFSLNFPFTDDALFEFFSHLDQLVLTYGGRVSLAKDVRLDPHHFRAMYPRLTQWQRVKATVDPRQKFQSNLSKRLQLMRML